MAKTPKKFPAFFFQAAGGSEPVREWLRSLDDADRKTIGEDIATAEFGWPIGMPICRHLEGGVWEIRSSLPSKREARVLFGVVRDQMILLHAFIKKSQKTPQRELERALKRLKEIRRG